MKPNAALIFVALAFTACRQMMVDDRIGELKPVLDSYMGHTEEEVVLGLGAPLDIQNAGGIKIFHYHKSFGVRSNAYANAQPNYYGGATAYGGGQSWESFDDYRIYFKDGLAVKWDGYVQR